MPTITLEDVCEVEVDYDGRCRGDWSPGTFGGVLKVKSGGRDSALHLARTVYTTSRENGHVLAATARSVTALHGLGRGPGGGVLLPTSVADLRMATTLILAHIPARGRPSIAKATRTPSGIELAPTVPALMRTLEREGWHDLLACHRGGGAILLDIGGGTFWAGLPALVTYPWSPISLADAVERGETAHWGPWEHLHLARHLLGGLNALHAAGVVHGDIRPCNILAEGDRRLPGNYGLAEYGRVPSSAPLDPSATYLLASSWDPRYWPPVTGEADFVEASRLHAKLCGDRLILATDSEASAAEATFGIDENLADDCRLLLVPPLAFDCLGLRRLGRRLVAHCQAWCWRIEGRFLVPAGPYAEGTRNIESVQIVKRPSAQSDLFSLAMVLLELFASGALPARDVADQLMSKAGALDAALLRRDAGIAMPILRRVSLSQCEVSDWPCLALWLRLALFCVRAGSGCEDARRIGAVVVESQAEQRALGVFGPMP